MAHHVFRRSVTLGSFAAALYDYLIRIGKPANSIWGGDDSSGGMADRLGNHDLAENGDPTYLQPGLCRAGTSIALDGTGDFFNKTTTDLAAGAGEDMTILGLIQVDASGVTMGMMSHGIDATWYGFECTGSDGNIRFLVDDGSLQVNAIGSTGGPFDDGQARIYAGVVDRTANQIRCTADGVDIQTATFNSELSIAGTGAFSIGGVGVAGSNPMVGLVDTVAYIPYALTAAELLDITALAGL